MKALFAVAVISTVAVAQPVRNAGERAADRRDLRKDRRQTADDRLDLAQARALLVDYDRAAANNEQAKLSAIEASFQRHIKREIAESRVESAQAQREVRQDKRELRADRREVRRDVATGAQAADDRRDAARDRANLADDRADAARERLSRERLVEIDAQLGQWLNKYDPESVARKHTLFAEVVGVERRELRRDHQEHREDQRELREDRREATEAR